MLDTLKAFNYQSTLESVQSFVNYEDITVTSELLTDEEIIGLVKNINNVSLENEEEYKQDTKIGAEEAFKSFDTLKKYMEMSSEWNCEMDDYFEIIHKKLLDVKLKNMKQSTIDKFITN